MKYSLEIDEFLKRSSSIPVIDVRSPAEFKRGHITGAVNIPLFQDKERAEVGIIYHHNGREEAIKKGLDITGPRMRSYVERAGKLAPEGELLVYCWRGGMRSESVAWLLRTAGMKPSTLAGGYKSYRNYVLSSFGIARSVLVLGGMTGSGKSEILKIIAGEGLPIIDLEELACHKGSVFGSLGQEDQPAQQQFENDLALRLNGTDPSQVIWTEDESKNIGRVTIPRAFYSGMHLSPLICIEMDRDLRMERIRREYGNFDPRDLETLILRIGRRLGGDNTNKAVTALRNGGLDETIRIMLDYYDKKYTHSILRRDRKKVFTVRLNSSDMKRNALLVMEKAGELKLLG